MMAATEHTNDYATSEKSVIYLAHMPQQAHVWRPDDDWTGVVDPKERRKLQNRQNQRKWRMLLKPHIILLHIGANVDVGEKRKAGGRRSTPASTATGSSSPDSNSHPPATEKKGTDTEITCANAPRNATEYLRWFEATAKQSYLAGSPQIDHLISLTRLNVHKAIESNIRAIGMTADWTCGDDTVSIFNLYSPVTPTFSLENIPASLRPTDIQRSIPHHPWLDFFPFPRMRDILIAAEHLFDDDELCHDLMAFWDTQNTQATLVVWGDSWDPRNWEVTEGFLRKWGWLLRGSPELVISTNYWRRRRGERPLGWRT